MNIGFDAKRFFHNQTGLGNYSRDLINSLCIQFPRNHYFLFDKDPSTLDLPANTIAVVPISNKILWREYSMRADVKRFMLDVYHGLSNELPWGKWPTGVRKIVTIHDVIFKSFPEQYELVDRLIYNHKTRHAVKMSDIIVATSHDTAKDLMKYYKADEKKLRVVYQTCGMEHWRNYSEKDITDFRNRHRLIHPFMLYVSSFQTRKNHLSLLKAFKLFDQNNIMLVLAGRQRETSKECIRFIKENGLEKRVLIIHDLNNFELPLLYRSAQSFIYPSMAEGFGIPLLEAACAGLPIAANNIGIFREIAPPSTAFFDVKVVESIVASMKEILMKTKEDYSGHLKMFTSDFASKKMMEIYKNEN